MMGEKKKERKRKPENREAFEEDQEGWVKRREEGKKRF